MATTGSEISESVLGRLAQAGWKWVLTLGIVNLLFGIVAVAWPAVTVVVLGVILGIYLIVSGIAIFISAFAPGIPGVARALAVITGVISVPLGFACLRDDLRSVVFLAVWIGVAWIFAGVSRLVLSFTAPSGTPGRVLTGIAGGIAILGGFVLMGAPITSVITLAWVSGIFLIASGIAFIIESFQVRKLAAA